MKVLSPAPRPSFFNALKLWKGWKTSSVVGGVLFAFGAIVVANDRVDDKKFAVSSDDSSYPPVVITECFSSEDEPIALPTQSSGNAVTPSSLLNYVSFETIEGRAFIKIQAVSNGPILVIDASTGEVAGIDETPKLKVILSPLT